MWVPDARVLWLSLERRRRDSLALGLLSEVSRRRHQLHLISRNAVQSGSRVTLARNLTTCVNSVLKHAAVLIEVRHLVGIHVCRRRVLLLSLKGWLVLHLPLARHNNWLLSLGDLSNLTLRDLSLVGELPRRKLSLGEEGSLLISSGGLAPHLLGELHGLRARIVPDRLALRHDGLSLLQLLGAKAVILIDSSHGLVQVFVSDTLTHLSGMARIKGRLPRRSCPLILFPVPLSHLALPAIVGHPLPGFQKLRCQFLCGGSRIGRQLRPWVVFLTELRWAIGDELAKSRLRLLLRADLTQPAEGPGVVALVGCKSCQIAASHSVPRRVRQGPLQIAVGVVKLALQEIGVTHVAQQVRVGRIGAERSQVMPFGLLILLRLIADPRKHVVRVKIRGIDVECLAEVKLRVRQSPDCQLLIATRQQLVNLLLS